MVTAAEEVVKNLSINLRLRKIAQDLLNEGFSFLDAIAYLELTEEVNPQLDEDEALKRMAAIRSKYTK